MSQKLPVGEVMNEAVQFGLHRWATVLRYGWIPGLLSLVLFGGYFASVFDTALFNENYEATSFDELKDILRVPLSTAIAGAVGVYLIAGLLFCGVAASLFRLVALGEERPGLFQLRLDGPAIRVFFAYMIVMLLTGGIWGAAFLGALSISGESISSLSGSLQALMEIIATAEEGSDDGMEAMTAIMGPMQVYGLTFLLGLVPMIYVSVKLIPFPPGSAAENRLLLFGSFGMTFGHFWSIVGIYILYFLFLIVIMIIYSMADTVLRMLAVLLVTQGSVFALVGMGVFMVLGAAAIFYQLFVVALQSAVPAIIYRRLKTGE